MQSLFSVFFVFEQLLFLHNLSLTLRLSRPTKAGARSDSAVTDKSFRSTSRSRSDRSRSRRHRSSSRNRKTQQPRSNSSGDTKRDTDATPVRRRVGWKPWYLRAFSPPKSEWKWIEEFSRINCSSNTVYKIKLIFIMYPTNMCHKLFVLRRTLTCR